MNLKSSLKMTIDKFGTHISQKKSMEEPEDIHQTPTTTIIEDTVKRLYYNIHLTFQSNTFLDSDKENKKYLLFNIKTCHVFFYEWAVIEYVVGYPADIITTINDKEFSLEELANTPLKRGDNISFRERDIKTENNNLLVEFFIRLPVGLSNSNIL